jgi:cytochrome c biogenesis protein CcdA/glutaredoxin-related protein
MKRIKHIIFIFILGLLISPLFVNVKAVNQIDIHFFHSQGCYNCAQMEDYFEVLLEEYDNINIIYYEINEADNMDKFQDVVSVYKETAQITLAGQTPTVFIGGLSFEGYNAQVIEDIENTIIRYSNEDYIDIVSKVLGGEEVLFSDFDYIERTTFRLPIIGEVNVEELSLFLAAVVIGFVDGFNPCAMWVLIFLITMLINLKDRKRMWIIGVTFLTASALIYMIIMFLWLGIVNQVIGASQIFRIAIGIFALAFGGYNVFKYFKNKKADVGCDVTDDTQRKKIIDRIKNIVKKQNLFIALIGVVILAATVNLIELACSAGLPLLFTSILEINQVSLGASFFYILIYIIMFLIDDLIIFAIAMFTMNVTGVSNKYSNLSTIIGGIIMLIIGVLLIFFPEIIMFNII